MNMIYIYRKYCTHHQVCKYSDDGMCPMECGYFEEISKRKSHGFVNIYSGNCLIKDIREKTFEESKNRGKREQKNLSCVNLWRLNDKFRYKVARMTTTEWWKIVGPQKKETLDVKTIKKIKKLVKAGLNRTDIAEQCDVSVGTVDNIKNGRIWRDV